MVWRWKSALPEEIPTERMERNPLITREGIRTLNSILKNPHAPVWNYQVGDRLRAEDLPAVERFRKSLFNRSAPLGAGIPANIIELVAAMRPRSLVFMERIPEGASLERDWESIPTMSREDIVLRIDDIVPLDADLSRMIVYETSGTTGHALDVPHHPCAMAKNHPVLEYILAQYGVAPGFGPDVTACLNVGAEEHTVVFANVFSVWNDAGFAKVNIHPGSWRREGDIHQFFQSLAPLFLTGDPVAFAQMMKWEIAARPLAMISTAVELNPGLKARLEERYGCPVIDYYSTTETGPIACSLPGEDALGVICPDIYVEAIDDDGCTVAEGEVGEITVTGGRNPFVPLLRYRTGDFGRVVRDERGARILDLKARQAVSFISSSGSMVHPLDIGRTLRLSPFVQSQFIQRRDKSIDLTIRPAPGESMGEGVIEERLRFLFGVDQVIRVHMDENLGKGERGGKVIPFICELGQAL
ncbi:MAG: AMP-binding protein [Nitrospinota bacterium]|nr:AMP-binding protein [Nitrospinota bacterium]